MLKLIIALPCPYCTLVTDFIERHNISNIEIHNTQWDPEEHMKLKQQYGKSQIPLLLINDSPRYESSDIIKYLKEHYL